MSLSGCNFFHVLPMRSNTNIPINKTIIIYLVKYYNTGEGGSGKRVTISRLLVKIVMFFYMFGCTVELEGTEFDS